tara:strand:- start:5275 stop:6510 length:1236 start_codon:yes stop_codon:yes gene_type:complete
MSKDWLPKYKKLPRWKYLRVDDWDTEWKAPMSDFELGFWTVNGFHTLEDAHQPTADARPPESLLGKIDYDRQIGWQVVESFKQNPYWYSNWNGSDHPNRFDEVSSAIPEGWRWHKEKIKYRNNKQGFRCDTDFDEIDWKNSYVITGCSHIYGIGQQKSETIGEIISNKIKAPVINLAIGGTGNGVILHNLVHLIRKYGKPKGIFVYWTYPTRFSRVLGYVKHTKDAWGLDVSRTWLRRDILPGTDTPANIRESGERVGPLMRELIITNEDMVSNSRHFYQRTMAQETLFAIMGEENVYQLRADNPGKVKEEDDSVDTDLLTICPSWTHDIIKNCIQLPIPNPNTPLPWKEFNNSDGSLSKAQLYILNKVKARDIHAYEPEGRGPIYGHWGPVMNKKVALGFVKQWRQRNEG